MNSKPYHPFSSRMEKPILQIYIILSLILFGSTAINIIRFLYERDYGEALLMDQVRRIENQETIYKWLLLRGLTNIFASVLSSIKPFTPMGMGMKVLIFPPGTTILQLLDCLFISP